MLSLAIISILIYPALVLTIYLGIALKWALPRLLLLPVYLVWSALNKGQL